MTLGLNGDNVPGYAELHCLSDFSFGRGASRAGELFERAKKIGYQALAITDECSLAGIVRALEASRATGLKLIVGSEISLVDGLKLVLLVQDIDGYRSLCRLITRGRRRADKGSYRLQREDLLEDGLPGLLLLWLPGEVPDAADGAWLRQHFEGRLWLAVELHRGAGDARRLQKLEALGQALDLPLLASGDVHMHVRRRRALQDTLTAIRHRCSIAEAGHRLFPNGERHLRSPATLAAIHPPALLAATLEVASRCHFTLDQLEYQYPRELVPDGHDAGSWLRELVEQGARWRWPGGVSAKVRALVEKELALIDELGYEPYFLTVHDIVRHARSQGILCQGRGSAANSAVCFALGVTEVDPGRPGVHLVFERFLSRERNEPPDIDIDFEHERREEVIQYIYRRYGRERAALAATVIRYRARSAVRDVARALGLPTDQIDQLSHVVSAWSESPPERERLLERGFDPDSPVMRRLVGLVGELMGMPRHLSQHVGGFVISEQPLHHLVPVENAAMADRTIIQWDKDDLDVLGLLKVDCLALGMLTCVRKCLDLLRTQRGRDLTPASIPAEDEETYRMIRRGDVVGVFQIESRAQMAMLPRLKPSCFYDLVIEVAIVRPGPIQGGMVHPYLRRKQGLEPVSYPSEELKTVLERTLGIPLFQEQVMELAMVAAGYTPGEADQLRRSMAAWKRHGGLEHHREKLLGGMLARGYTADFAERLFEQIKGFGSYGFPESHATSFALITYVSCWLKCHEPAAFACALLNSLPMGFYQPPQIVYDLRRQRGVEVRPADVCHSDWDSTLEPWPDDRARQPALRLGLRTLRGMQQEAAERIRLARAKEMFISVTDLCRRAALDRRSRDLLTDGGALASLAGHRHRARWISAAIDRPPPLFANPEADQRMAARHVADEQQDIGLPPPSAAEDVLSDYASSGLTLGPHPLSLIREQLARRRCRRSAELDSLPNGQYLRAAGLVTLRQRPGTASGVTFVTLEDEDGLFNVVVWKSLADQQRRVLLEADLLAVDGRLERAEGVRHLIAERLHDFTSLARRLDSRSRDFR